MADAEAAKATKQYLVKMYISTIETWHRIAEKIGLQGWPTHESSGLPGADDCKALADRLMATVAATGGSPTGQEPTEQPVLKTAKEPQPDEPDELQPAQPVWPDAYLDRAKELVTVEVNRSREEDIPGPSTDLTETGQRKDTGAEIAKRPNLDEVPYSSVLAWAITDGSEKPTQSWLYAQCQQAGLQMPRDFMEVEVYSNGRPTTALKFWKRTHNETDAMEYFLTREDDKFFLSAYKEAGLITAMKALQPVLSRGVMGVPPNATIVIRTLTAADLIEPREPKAAREIQKPRAAEALKEAGEPLQKRPKLDPEPAVPPRPQPSERQLPPAPSRPTTATRAPPPPRTLTHRPAPTTSESRYNSREPSARTFRDTGRRDGSNYSSEWYGWYANDGENRYSGDAARNRHAGERRR